MSYDLTITRTDDGFIALRGTGSMSPEVDEAMLSMGKRYLIDGKLPAAENPTFAWYRAPQPSDYWSIVCSHLTSDKNVIEPLVQRAAEVLRNAGHTVTIKPRPLEY